MTRSLISLITQDRLLETSYTELRSITPQELKNIRVKYFSSLEMRHQAQHGLMRRMPTIAMDRHGLVGVVVPHLIKVGQEGAEWHRVRAMALALIEEAQGE